MHAALLLLLLLVTATPTILAASGAGFSTRYWDCCKPSCAWSKKASVSKPVATCDRNYHGRLTDVDAKSGCDNGPAFACANNSPFAVNDRLAYGFAATAINGGTEASWCCACFKHVSSLFLHLFRALYTPEGQALTESASCGER